MSEQERGASHQNAGLGGARAAGSREGAPARLCRGITITPPREVSLNNHPGYDLPLCGVMGGKVMNCAPGFFQMSQKQKPWQKPGHLARLLPGARFSSRGELFGGSHSGLLGMAGGRAFHPTGSA